MGLRCIPADFIEAAPLLRDAGVASLRFADDESVSDATFYDRPDTIPCPPPIDGPHPEVLPEDEPPGVSVDRELEWLSEWDEVLP